MKNAAHNFISRLLPLVTLVGLASPASTVSVAGSVWTTNGPEGWGDIQALAIEPANRVSVTSTPGWRPQLRRRPTE